MPTALVTGASRGVGKGVATALSGAGFHVFATGRTIARAALPPPVVRLTCDHTRDEDTAAAFERIAQDAAALDLVVNCAWGGYERMVDDQGTFTWTLPFWEQPPYRWSSMIDAGVRAAFVVSQHAARLMVAAQRGLIVNISFWAAQKHVGNAVYGVSKAATDKLTFDMAHELRPHGVTVVSLYPGMVRTEAVLAAAAGGWLDLANSESPEFIGRVIAALYADPAVSERSGRIVIAAAAARELGIADVDGRRPVPLTLASV
jgi:NAD(P)-dependent dehydrogenase (short-subunit alcohol dehydrogenase family)